MAKELGQQTVDFATLVTRAAEDSYQSLKDLVDHSRSDQSDAQKKIGLLKFIHMTQQRMLRLNVLSKWCRQIPLTQYCQQLGSTLSFHDTCFTQAADSIYFMHEGLQKARAPMYDVSSAIEILLTGTYEKFPKCVEDVGMQSCLNEDQQKSALRKLDTLVRSKLLETPLPKEFSCVSVSDGTASIQVDGEFKVIVTLGYRGHLTLWRILNLELLVGEKSGLIQLEKTRKHVLGDDLERRMAESKDPFRTLYSVLHELCLALVMDTVIRQVQALRQGRWKGAIHFELLSDGTSRGRSSTSTQMNQDTDTEYVGLRTPGLKLMYWIDFNRSSNSSDSGSTPFIMIEPGSGLQIKCSHSSFIVDPSTDKEAVFTLDHGCIDVEKMLLEAICCNKYTRLLEIYKQLTRNGQICQAPGDVVLQTLRDDLSLDNEQQDSKAKENKRKEVLRVRAYGSLFFTLNINIRNGRFLLQSSRDVFAPSILLESEEALNQANTTIGDIFSSLRCRSILHCFASIGRFLGLEVFEQVSTPVKVPKPIGSTSLLLGFPNFGWAYYLLVELDKDFRPLFQLLETLPEPSGKDHASGDFSDVIRTKKIDLAQIQLLEDEVNLSLPDIGKVLSSSKNSDISKHDSEQSLLSDLGLQGSSQTLGFHSSSFSFAVDDVFDFEKGVSPSYLAVQSASSSFEKSHGSQFGPLPSKNSKPGRLSYQWNKYLPQVSGDALSGASLKYVGLSNSSSSVIGSSLSSQGRDAPKKLSASKSDQDLASLQSPRQLEVSTCSSLDDDHLRIVRACSKEASVMGNSAVLLSPSQPSSLQVFGPNTKPTGVKSLHSRPVCVSDSSMWVSTSICPAPELTNSDIATHEANFTDGCNKKKRTISELLKLVPSLLNNEPDTLLSKRRKVSQPGHVCDDSGDPVSLKLVNKSDGHSYSKVIEEANKGNAPSSIYISALLHVVKHCSLSIKHAQLTSQMKALEIPFVEESGLRDPSFNLWFRLPFARSDSWPKICLGLGKPGSMHWDVKITDKYFQDLWELQKESSNTPWGCGVRIANTSDVDSHIRFDAEGVVLSYQSVESDSIKKLVADIRRLSHARMFSLGMRKLLGVRFDEKTGEGGITSEFKPLSRVKTLIEGSDKLSEQLRRAFRIEAVGLTSMWFSFGSGILARFVVEWEVAKEGCTMHVSPEQIWPHTKFLEDFINEAEVASLLDCIRLTAGPLHALAAATRPARASPVPYVAGVAGGVTSPVMRQNGHMPSQGQLLNTSTTQPGQTASGSLGNPVMSDPAGSLGNPSFHSAAIMAAAGRGGPGIVPSSLLPIDVSVVLRGPYWVRIIYRKHFAVDMRCFAGDQVWLQPATPPKGGPSVGGSLPCPQFRPFIMEHVAQELNGLDPNIAGGQLAMGLAHASNQTTGTTAQPSTNNGNKGHLASPSGLSRQGNQVFGVSRTGNAISGPSNVANASLGSPLRRSPATGGVPAHVRGELNTAIIGLGDDGGYGGGWVPLLALKKVLRGILKYLGVLWLFAQLPDLLREILGSILRDNEGALLNLDQEQPALRFFVGGYVFAVSVHRVQLLLQVLSVKRFHQQQQPQQNAAPSQEELTSAEIGEICDYFSRRVASEPYDASRVASFITLLTLPISVLREFLKLIAWKKGLVQAQSGDMAPTQKPRIELCLENHVGFCRDGNSDSSSMSKSNIHYNRPNNSVDFGLTVVLDPAYIPHINAAGGAAWLPNCVSVRLRYSFAENPTVSIIRMEGSHGGRACWVRLDDWERCKQSVSRTVDMSGGVTVDSSQGRLRVVADNIQRTLHTCLQGLRQGAVVTGNTGGGT